MHKLKCFEIIILDVSSLLLPVPVGKKDYISFMANLQAVLGSTSILIPYEKRKRAYHKFTTDFIESLGGIRCSAT